MLFLRAFFVFVQMSGIFCDFYDLYTFSQIYGLGREINRNIPRCAGIAACQPPHAAYRPVFYRCIAVAACPEYAAMYYSWPG